ncbi:hypothetical protein PSCICF_09760 [Pseudomonas cichorii]|nr:hypothetical protein PSCICF_09760 [Pseudomonas cichorii]GFM60668.1 hypothetical protein PSCICG_18280 [Pseudomonas cichorii]
MLSGQFDCGRQLAGDASRIIGSHPPYGVETFGNASGGCSIVIENGINYHFASFFERERLPCRLASVFWLL